MQSLTLRRSLVSLPILGLAWPPPAAAQPQPLAAEPGRREREFAPELFDANCGRGAPRTLAQAGYSLVSARARFGSHRISSLNQQLDYACIQRAIDGCAAAGGGVVRLASGTYVISAPGATTMDTLIVPHSGTSGLGRPVSILGTAMGATRLAWQRDLGAGCFAISCGDPGASRSNGRGRYAHASDDGDFHGIFADFSLEGPGPQPDARRMSGMAWGARRRVYRVMARWFRAGFDMVGDHSHLESVEAINCTYGFYFPEPSSHLYGDIHFLRCSSGEHAMAAIGIHPDCAPNSCEFHSCFFGTSPYAIFKESGGSVATVMSNSTFVSCMFEHIGNAWIGEEEARKSSRLERCSFDAPFFSWDDRRILAGYGRGRGAMWDLHGVDNCTVTNMRDPQRWWPRGAAATAVFDLNRCGGLFLRGDLGRLLQVTPAGRFLRINGPSESVGRVRWESNGTLRGAFARVGAGARVSLANLCESVGFEVQPATVAERMPAGVALQAGEAGDIVPLATAGSDVTVMLEGTDRAVLGGQLFRKGRAGGVLPAAHLQDGFIIGSAVWSDGEQTVRLRLLPLS